MNSSKIRWAKREPYCFIRWVTRGKTSRYCLIYDYGSVIWAIVDINIGIILRSSGAFYDNMAACDPLYRKCHPSAKVEAVRAIRRRCSALRKQD